MIRRISRRGRCRNVGAKSVKENREGLIPNESKAPGSKNVLDSDPKEHGPENGAGGNCADIGNMIKGYEEGDVSPPGGASGEGSKGEFADTPPNLIAFSRKIEIHPRGRQEGL